MFTTASTTVTAFEGHRCIASGALADVAEQAKAVIDQAMIDKTGGGAVLIFDDRTSAQVEVDFRGSVEDVRARLAASTQPRKPELEPARRGRPKLGVTAREVTLLPRQWDWLATQPGGASATLRRLIEQARKQDAGAEAVRAARDALYRFMTAIAGDVAGYEDALRALFAGQSEVFIAATAAWPADVRDHAWRLAPPAFGLPPSPLDAAIPFDRRSAVQRAVDTAFPGQEILASVPVFGGASGARVFRLTVQTQDRLLRLESARDALRDPARQYACMKIAAEAGVAPRLIYADAQDGVAITDFIQLSPPDPAVSRASRLRLLGKTVATLHAAPLFPSLVDIIDGVGAVIQQAEALGAMPSVGLDRMHRLFADLKRIYPRDPADQVSSHNDLNPTNVLFEGERVWIVDWESAFAADRYMDLAAVANFFATDEAEEEQILSAYFGAGLNDHHRAKLVVMQQLNRLFYAAMLLSAAVAAEPGLKLTPADLDTPRYGLIRTEAASIATTAGKARFACAFLNEADHAFVSPRFAWAAERLKA